MDIDCRAGDGCSSAKLLSTRISVRKVEQVKISKITIKHYRSCEDAVFIPHESLSALIGPNGSGKTNILSAIKLLPSLCYSRSRHYGADDPITSACEIKTWYEVDNVQITHTAKLNIVTNEKNQDEIISSEELWAVPSNTVRRKKNQHPLLDNFWLISRAIVITIRGKSKKRNSSCRLYYSSRNWYEGTCVIGESCWADYQD